MLWLAASGALGVALFRMLAGLLGWSFLPAILISGCIPLATFVFLLRCVTGKPKSYAADLLQWQSFKLRQWLSERRLTALPRGLFGIDPTGESSR